VVDSRYPQNWKEISYRVKCKAKWRCEFCGARYGSKTDKGTKVNLQVAHLGVPYPDGRPGNPADKLDCREENLKALCSRCHINWDFEERAQSPKSIHYGKRMKRAFL
jgi:hypothetical protein